MTSGEQGINSFSPYLLDKHSQFPFVSASSLYSSAIDHKALEHVLLGSYTVLLPKGNNKYVSVFFTSVLLNATLG